MLAYYRYVGNRDCIGCLKVTYWVLGPLFCDRRVAIILAVRMLTEYVAGSGSSAMRTLTLRLLISYIYGAPSKARNANVVYIWTYVWQR